MQVSALDASSRTASSAAVSRTLESTLSDRWELTDAWRRVKSAGASPGPDGITIQAFEQNLEHNLTRLASGIANGRYRPGRLGRRFVRKRDGGTRVIGIPNVSDRVLQSAAAHWLHERIEPLLLPTTFAYRPSLGPQRAAAFCSRLATEYAWVVTSDVAKYFDNVDHDILMRLLQALQLSPRDREIVLGWLRATSVDAGASLVTLKGLPQGLAIAPPLANLYLHDFDCRLRDAGWAHCRFADDFVVFAPTETDARARHEWMAGYLSTERRLAFKSSKTAVEPTAKGFDFVGFRIDQEGLRFPNDAPDRFKSSLQDRLKRLADDVEATVRTVNDLVRGWRAYYGGMSEILTRQVEVLEAWRRVRVAAALSEAGHPQLWLAKLFESLTACTPGAIAGAYGPDAGREDRRDVPSPNVRRSRPVERGPSVPVTLQRRSPRRRSAVRALAIGLKQRPWVTPLGDVIVPVHGAFVTKAGENLLIKRKKQTVLELPLAAVKHVSVVGAGVSVASGAVAACAARGVRIWVSDSLGRGVGSFVSRAPAARPETIARLLQASQTVRGTALARALLSGKIRNQRALLLYYSKGATRADKVRTSLRQAAAGLRGTLPDLRTVSGPMRRVRTQLFLTEARAAALYWAAWTHLVPSELSYPGRRGRGATDPVNSLLNYGYSRLLQLVWQAVDRVGLSPWHGVLHTGRRRAPALVLDLMEEFRVPSVDRVVLGLLGRGFAPALRPNGRLTLRSQVVFERAWAKNLLKPFGDAPLERVVRQQAAAFRRALEARSAYRPVVLQW